MKKIVYIFLIALAGLGFNSCKEADLKIEESIFDVSEVNRNEFDKWLLKNYTYPYNIDFKYKLEDIESDMDYNLAPAEIEKAKTLAKIIKYVWLESYDEVAGIEFTRKYVPKMIHLIGSAAYNDNGSFLLGTAEGGLKVTLYYVNSLEIDPDFLNHFYFKTMHHEFAHILHQTKNFDPGFQKISESSYVGGDWIYKSDAQALQAGFVSPYSSSEPAEDFVENISIYVTNPPEVWEQMLEVAGDAGAATIIQKFEIVRKYMSSAWNIDIDELRETVLRRTNDLKTVDIEKL